MLWFAVSPGDQAWGQMKEAKKREFMHREKLGKKESQMFCPTVLATAGHMLVDPAGPFTIWEVDPRNGKRFQAGRLFACVRK